MGNKDHGNQLVLTKLTQIFQMPNPSLFAISDCFLDAVIKRSVNLSYEGTYFQKIPKTLCNLHLTFLYMDCNTINCISMKINLTI